MGRESRNLGVLLCGDGRDHVILLEVLPIGTLGLFQLVLGLLNVDGLALQLQLRQGGVEAQQDVALLDLVALGDQKLRDLLGRGGVEDLDAVRLDAAVEIIVAPEIRVRLDQIAHRIDLAGLAVGAQDRIDAEHGADQKGGDQNGENQFLCFAHCGSSPGTDRRPSRM